MVSRESVTFLPGDDIATLPEGSAVYLIRPKQGQSYLGRTNILRKRIARLWAKWNLGQLADCIEYWPTASRLEQWLLSYELARQHFPNEYERLLRLPKPAYVKLILNDEFPRTQIATRLAGAQSQFFGPFPNRATASQFESQLLDLFQLRRCQDDLVASLEHPGCIYGEMRMCLRPCQEAVSPAEYASEARRVSEFLATRGARMLETAANARDRSSAELNFEEAAREHARHEKIEQLTRLPGELAHDVASLDGVAVTASVEPQCVSLWFMRQGVWLGPRLFSVAPLSGKSISLDARLREIVAALETPKPSMTLRQHHLALLAKWFFSSWRDGEWLGFDGPAAVPYRKLVNAIHRVAQEGTNAAT